MHHAQCASGVLVIVCEPLREEELHDSCTRTGLHPDKGSETISVNTHHDLARCQIPKYKDIVMYIPLYEQPAEFVQVETSFLLPPH